MAPPHAIASEKAGKKIKPSNTSAAAASASKHMPNHCHWKANEQNGVQKAANRPTTTQDRVKHVADPANKVGKDKKVRQRGGRGKGRGRAKDKAAKDASQSSGSEDGAAISADTAHKSTADNRRTLLTLPEEIRHEILTLVLKEPQVVEIHFPFSGMSLYGCLFACRQLSDEGHRVWLKANRFRLLVDRFDPALPLWWAQIQVHCRQTAKTELVLRESHNWHNLFKWCTLVFDGEDVMAPELARIQTTSAAIASAALRIAQAMVGKPVEEFTQTMEQFRLALEYLDAGWV